jgi:hypothetical protein
MEHRWRCVVNHSGCLRYLLPDGRSRRSWTGGRPPAFGLDCRGSETGHAKTYSVNFLGVARFMYSNAGEEFLRNQTTSYFPYWGMRRTAVQALRSAIIADAVDGQISSATIMAWLPTDMRLADTCNTYSGSQDVCAQGRCNPDNGQCTSLLSWYVYLPQCIQQNQASVAALSSDMTTPTPVQQQGGVRALL